MHFSSNMVTTPTYADCYTIQNGVFIHVRVCVYTHNFLSKYNASFDLNDTCCHAFSPDVPYSAVAEHCGTTQNNGYPMSKLNYWPMKARTDT